MVDKLVAGLASIEADEQNNVTLLEQRSRSS